MKGNTMKTTKKPLAAIMGVAFVAAMSQAVQAAENPFATTELQSGYKVAANHEGKCGEGKCGEDMMSKSEKESAKAHKGMEGKCGEEMKDRTEKKAAKAKTAMEGKCGEGKCGGDMKDKAAKKADKAKEGKCGEGKCGS
jgi:uncharacterized low-complexity protein